MKTAIFVAFRRPPLSLWALSCLGAILTLGRTQAQGTFVPFNWPRVYDQECTLTGREGDPWRGLVYVRSASPLGQSFTPTLPQVGFLQVCMSWDSHDGLTVNLREDSITGPIIGSLGPYTSLPWNIVYHYAEFAFASPVAVIPGRRYVFELVQNGNGAAQIAYYPAGMIDYAGGSAIWKGSEIAGVQLWFREGVVVPEPSTVVLLLFGGIVLAAWRWCRR